MGCDIHAFVEYAKAGSYESQTIETLDIPRDYALFTVMALGEGGLTDELPYPPRGIPSGLSAEAKNYFYTPAEEVQEMVEEWFGDDEPFEPEEYAKAHGKSAQKEFLAHQLLPTPELYFHSWLTVDELNEVLSYGKLSKEDLSDEFRSILTSMESLAKSYGSKNVRIVFCFDGAG